MSPDLMRRYVREVLQRRAEREGWESLRIVADAASGLTSTGPAELALRACRAAGGEPQRAFPAAASLYCLHTAIHLVDDIIDGEERPFLPLPPGLRANFAMALQSLAVELLAPTPGEVRAELMRAVALAGTRTARGQELDAGGAAGEEDYWKIAESKTPPLFAAALQMGVLSGGADAEVAEGLAEAGTPMGVLVQLGDDLGDVMGEELHPDWERPGDNIVLRFALEADHPERERFRALVGQVADPAAYDEAKEIIVRSGAMSFCVHHMLVAAEEARRVVRSLPLADHAPVLEMIDLLIAPAAELLAELGASPDEVLSAV